LIAGLAPCLLNATHIIRLNGQTQLQVAQCMNAWYIFHLPRVHLRYKLNMGTYWN
jgi:hypothetical protein